MSTIKTNTLTGTTSAGSILVTGEGGSTTTNLQQGIAKCWVNFDGTAGSLSPSDSHNVTSLTDNGTGDYTITIASDMGNTNYCSVGSGQNASGTAFGTVFNPASAATGTLQVKYHNAFEAIKDGAQQNVLIHGDLA